MKRYFGLFVLLCFLCSCGNVNDFPIHEKVIVSGEETEDDPEGGEEDVPVDLKDDIVIDETPLKDEKETVVSPAMGGMYKDFLANFLYDDEKGTWDEGTFDAVSQQWTKGVKTLTVTFSDDDVAYALTSKKGNPSEITDEDFTVRKEGAHLTVFAHTKCNYVLKGTAANGSFKLYTDKKCIVTLSGVRLTNPNGAAINIQKGNDGGKRTFLVVAKDTKNYLCDGASYTKKLYPGTQTEEDEKGTIFSEGKICVSGDGYLLVESKGKNAMACDDYVYLHKGTQITLKPTPGYDGLKTKDGIYLAGGVVNVTCSGEAAKGLNTDGVFRITGGRATVVSTAVPSKDAEDGISHPYCLKCEGSMEMSAGALLLSASKVGGNGIYVKDAMTLSGGTIKLIAKEQTMVYGSFAKTGGVLSVNGETVE